MPDHTLTDRLTSIPGLRSDVAERVADAYPDAEKLSQATQDDLTDIQGIGAVTAARIVEAFSGTAQVESAAPAAPEPRPSASEQPAATPLDPVRREAEQAENPVDTIRIAARVVVTGAFAVVGTVRQQLPEVKQSVGNAAGAIVQLGRELGRALLRRAS